MAAFMGANQYAHRFTVRKCSCLDRRLDDCDGLSKGNFHSRNFFEFNSSFIGRLFCLGHKNIVELKDG